MPSGVVCTQRCCSSFSSMYQLSRNRQSDFAFKNFCCSSWPELQRPSQQPQPLSNPYCRSAGSRLGKADTRPPRRAGNYASRHALLRPPPSQRPGRPAGPLPVQAARGRPRPGPSVKLCRASPELGPIYSLFWRGLTQFSIYQVSFYPRAS